MHAKKLVTSSGIIMMHNNSIISALDKETAFAVTLEKKKELESSY